MPSDLWFVFLRGMNLGGRRITNDDLCTAVVACGFEDVTAYQASGNLVIRADTTEASLVRSLEEGLETELGYAVPTFVRSTDELRRLTESEPFDEGQLAASKGKRQVILLHDAPDDGLLAQIHELVPDDEVIVAAGRDLHWLPAAGLSDSPIDLRRIDTLAGGTTIRTHGTLQRMTGKFL